MSLGHYNQSKIVRKTGLIWKTFDFSNYFLIPIKSSTTLSPPMPKWSKIAWKDTPGPVRPFLRHVTQRSSFLAHLRDNHRVSRVEELLTKSSTTLSYKSRPSMLKWSSTSFNSVTCRNERRMNRKLNWNFKPVESVAKRFQCVLQKNG